ncbi:hypothetical protein ACJX0J_018683, partial [Zea mays]
MYYNLVICAILSIDIMHFLYFFTGINIFSLEAYTDDMLGRSCRDLDDGFALMVALGNFPTVCILLVQLNLSRLIGILLMSACIDQAISLIRSLCNLCLEIIFLLNFRIFKSEVILS